MYGSPALLRADVAGIFALQFKLILFVAVAGPTSARSSQAIDPVNRTAAVPSARRERVSAAGATLTLASPRDGPCPLPHCGRGTAACRLSSHVLINQPCLAVRRLAAIGRPGMRSAMTRRPRLPRASQQFLTCGCPRGR